MKLELLFWIVFIIGTFFHFYGLMRTDSAKWPWDLPVWFILFLLGVGTFGWPIR